MKRCRQSYDSASENLLSAPERFEQVHAKHKNRIAVRSGYAVMSYEELAARANELAAKLAIKGVSHGDLVAICMERSQDVVISILGIWKAGAAFLPLDPDFPEMRQLHVLEDAAPSVVIVDQHNLRQMQNAGVEPLVFQDHVTGETAASPAVTISADSLAYVIFTSGSTGRAKGVAVSHGALSNFLAVIQQPLQLQPSDTLAAVTTLSFDISILEMILPLMQGATVAILNKTASGDGKRLAEALELCKATFMQATPATWHLLLDAGWEGDEGLAIVCGGERLSRPLAEQLLHRSNRVFNAYGPTEATIWATLEQVESGEGAVPIGRALGNYSTVVLNDALAVVVPGMEGQLYLGGPSLATGYINRPDETKRRFIDHPDFGRLYATGDRVREVDDGKLEFLGRIDEQVKIHGFRVEPGDIEAHLLALTGVKEAFAMLRKDGRDPDKLVAYIIPDGTVELTSKYLRGALSKRLPNYMIPHHFVQLKRFPRTSSSKVDRRQLPDPVVHGESSKEAAEDTLEAYLRSVWIEVLGTSAIGITENFFDLGGDSLQAAHVTNRVEERLREVVWPVVLFDAPTIAEFADYLRRTYPGAVARQALSQQSSASESTNRPIDEAMIEAFTSLVKPLAPAPVSGAKNSPAIFVLCPPRSGSTLLRAILAGHPQLFAPPEIELLTFNTMQERAEVFSGRESYRLEGVIRAVMAIKDCDVEEARMLLNRYERMNTSIQEFYGVLQSWLPGRVLVDKTPSNALDLAALHRIEDYFRDPVYIHLTRHPLGMICSFLEARLSEVFFRREPHSFSLRELAELIWFASHNNSLAVLESVPAKRQFTLSFENLTLAPEEAVRQLCDFLAMEPHPEMLKPWEDRKAKMTDGLHPESKMMGDPKFHQYQHIDDRVASRWQDQMQSFNLGVPTRELAFELGYTNFGNTTEPGEREEFVL